MRIVRATPFELGTVLWPLRPGAPLMLLVVKATYELQHGVAAHVAKEQDTLSGPLSVDDDPDRSLRYPGDFDPLKPTGECFLVGSCHPPGGRARASEVRFKCGAIDKRIAVFGDRHWEGSLLGRRASEPEPFDAMPLAWERAFGGPGHASNPYGRGAVPIEGPEGKRHPLPNLERPGALVDAPSAKPDPAAVAPIHPTAPARLRLAGTYDETWQRERFPYYPVDLHPDYFLSAPEDQRARTFWAGTETIGLGHLHPEHAWLESRLPGLRPRAFVERGNDAGGPKLDEIHLKLDTIVVDADRLRVCCLHRGLFAVRDADASDVKTMFLLHERVGEQQSLEAVTDLFDAQLRLIALEEAGFSPLDPQDDADAHTLMRIRETAASLGAKNATAHTLAQVIATMVDLPAMSLGGPKVPDVEEPAPVADAAAVAEGFGKLGKETPEALADAVEEDPVVGETARERALLDYAEGRGWSGDLTRLRLGGEVLDELVAEGVLLAGADLSACSLRAAKLAGAQLHGARFAGADLSGADLRGADLTGAVLDGALLDGATLDGAVLDRATLDGASLRGASLAQVEARGASFSGANLEGAKAPELVLVHGALRDARCKGATFVDARFAGVDATGADLSECDLSLLRGYDGARFDGANLSRATADRARFGGSSLAGADFAFASLERASFASAILRGARLDGCRLKKAKLKGADLSEAKIRGADLMRAKMGGAILSQTDFTGSSLFAAELLGVFVDRTVWGGADLSGTKLEGRLA